MSGKLLYRKGTAAEGTENPKSVSGTIQNMYRTVTNVERYRYFKWLDYAF